MPWSRQCPKIPLVPPWEGEAPAEPLWIGSLPPERLGGSLALPNPVPIGDSSTKPDCGCPV